MSDQGKDKLIVSQQLEIQRLTSIAKNATDVSNKIHGILYSIGAPLNDNILGYSKKQMMPLFEIRDLSETLGCQCDEGG